MSDTTDENELWEAAQAKHTNTVEATGETVPLMFYPLRAGEGRGPGRLRGVKTIYIFLSLYTASTAIIEFSVTIKFLKQACHGG